MINLLLSIENAWVGVYARLSSVTGDILSEKPILGIFLVRKLSLATLLVTKPYWHNFQYQMDTCNVASIRDYG